MKLSIGLFFVLTLTACTVSLPLKPTPVRSVLKEMAARKASVGGGYSAFANEFLGMTLTGSSSFTPGINKLRPHKALKMMTLRDPDGHAPTIDFFDYQGTCAISPALPEELSRAVAGVFLIASNRYFGRMQIAVYFVPSDTLIRNETYRFNLGSKLRFRFYMPCNPATPDLDAFIAATIVLHEMTHVTVDLNGATPTQLDGELTAIGSSMCLFREVRKHDPVRLMDAVTEQQYLDNSFEIIDVPQAQKDRLCERWASRIDELSKPAGLRSSGTVARRSGSSN